MPFGVGDGGAEADEFDAGLERFGILKGLLPGGERPGPG